MGFHLMAKPSGSTCNLDCQYCFFLSKEALHPDSDHRMSDATLQAYLGQWLASHRTPGVTIAWQGGEPTLMGLAFFERAVEVAEALKRPGQRLQHAIQTNGIALDDDWCAFLAAKQFLVGLSVDGPRELHDAYRLTRAGKGSFDLVMNGWRALRRHRVEFNILCTVNAANEAHGRRVYRFLRDELGARFVQFIPIVERVTGETIAIANADWSTSSRDKRPLYTQTGDRVTRRSVSPEGYGRFLIDVFEEWVRHDVGRVFVQLFDVTLEALFGRHLLCVHAPTCGHALALEHNGDVYACDHFVQPDHLLGNLHATPLDELVGSPQQRAFGQAKLDTLTRQCQACDVRHLCHGDCPKERFATSKDGEPGHSYLCAGLHAFFTHVTPSMRQMASLVMQRQPPAAIMATVAARDARAGPYSPCPCGSGAKLKFCHGRPAASRDAISPTATTRRTSSDAGDAAS